MARGTKGEEGNWSLERRAEGGPTLRRCARESIIRQMWYVVNWIMDQNRTLEHVEEHEQNDIPALLPQGPFPIIL